VVFEKEYIMRCSSAEWIAGNGCALRWCHRGVGRWTEENVGIPDWTAQLSVRKTTGKDSSEACAIACQICAVYSVFPSGMMPHIKIAQFNWKCIGRLTAPALKRPWLLFHKTFLRKLIIAIFEVLTEVLTAMIVCYNMTCRFVNIFRRFGGKCYFFQHNPRRRRYIPTDMTSYRRRFKPDLKNFNSSKLYNLAIGEEKLYSIQFSDVVIHLVLRRIF